MASNEDFMRAGATGVGWTGAVGVTFPTGFATPATGWTDVGYISDDGLTQGMSEERKSWTPWGRTAPVKTQLTKAEKTFKIVMWETNVTTLGLYYKQPASALIPDVTTDIINFTDANGLDQDQRAFLFDVADGANNLIRHAIPLGEVTGRGDIVNKTDEIIAYEITITAYPGSDGVSVHSYFKLAGIEGA
jgi:hypothetical protein